MTDGSPCHLCVGKPRPSDAFLPVFLANSITQTRIRRGYKTTATGATFNVPMCSKCLNVNMNICISVSVAFVIGCIAFAIFKWDGLEAIIGGFLLVVFSFPVAILVRHALTYLLTPLTRTKTTLYCWNHPQISAAREQGFFISWHGVPWWI